MRRIETVTFTIGLMMSGLLMFASIAPVSTEGARQAAPVELAAAPLSGQAL